ncbi:MAG: FAD-binding oxidoreductase, partial [Desulfobacterales bacterium]|nr:FAD-binding oxidoreductase [Desulfobacterales bacterium]
MTTYHPAPEHAEKCNILIRRLAGIIPDDRLITDTMRRIALGTDAGLYRKVPGLIVKVDTEKELTAVMAACNTLDLPFTFRGSGTSVSGQAVSDAVLIMLTRSWNRCTISEDGRRVRTGPGVTGGEINQQLSHFGRKLGPDPASLQSATIGGIVANNSSGMTCGVANNSQNTLRAMRLILADGTILDTADPDSRKAFRAARPDIVEGLTALAAQVRWNPAMTHRIKKKYAIKNTTGFSVNALVDHDDPLDMLFHLMVGSEGCLGFISSVEFETVQDPAHRATAMIVFKTLSAGCDALLRLKTCKVTAAELMDRATIRALEELPEIPSLMKGLGPDAAALLVETRAEEQTALHSQVSDILATLEDINTAAPVEFVYDAKTCARLWEIRDGFDPIICAKAPAGTIMISEDVALNIQDLAPAIGDFHDLFHSYGYTDAVIFGHALAGNLHFVLLQDFNDPAEISRYKAFVEELVDIVVDKYDGSLKAEHGTGRNMAPFVSTEWGEEIYGIMGKIKSLLDPGGLLNPGVILTDNPNAHVAGLKTFPAVNPLVDQCIECGFCERFCVANDLTLSPRQRIVTLRTLAALTESGANPGLLAALERHFNHQVLDTCAADGLCALACPSGINTGKMVKNLRSHRTGQTAKATGKWIGRHMDVVTAGARAGLQAGHAALAPAGEATGVETTTHLNHITCGAVPKWFRHMPLAQKPMKIQAQRNHRDAVVYFPSCINRTFGADRKTPADKTIFHLVQHLCKKAGLDVIIPGNTEKLCCGLSFASKGHKNAARERETALNRALMAASGNGKFPVLCDMSPCLLHMKETLSPSLSLMEPVAFALTHLVPRLSIRKVKHPIVVHPVCSLKKMGLSNRLVELAELCAEHVVVTNTNCCGFAGDKGFTTPELNRHGLVDLRDQIPDGA